MAAQLGEERGRVPGEHLRDRHRGARGDVGEFVEQLVVVEPGTGRHTDQSGARRRVAVTGRGRFGPGRLAQGGVQVGAAGGTWLQATGALLCVVFFLGLVQRAGAEGPLAGRVVLLGSAVLMSVVLAESVFTLSWVTAASAGEPGSARASYDLMARFIQVFPIVPAPAVYLPLGAVLADGRVLPRAFARTATVLGGGFLLLGLAGVLTPLAQAGTGG